MLRGARRGGGESRQEFERADLSVARSISFLREIRANRDSRYPIVFTDFREQTRGKGFLFIFWNRNDLTASTQSDSFFAAFFNRSPATRFFDNER